MTQDTNTTSNNLNELADILAHQILTGDKKEEAVALKIIETEERPEARPFPVQGKVGKKVKDEYLRAKAQRILEMRVKGYSFDEIADYLEYKSGKHAKAAYDRFMSKFEREDVISIRQLQAERLEMAWRGLAPAIEKGNARSVEVGMKVLERQSRLLGIDIADQLVEKTSNQPIQINIMAHPEDVRAKDLVIEHQPRLLEAKNELARDQPKTS